MRAPPASERELGLGREPGQALLLGLPGLPGPGAARAGLGLLAPEAGAIGVELTEAYQLVPEQSTAAIVVHHPEAKYFSARRGNLAAADGDEEGAEEAAEVA